MRERGMVPTGVVVIGVGLWLADQLPPGHCLVVPDEADIERLDLSLIAGIDTAIVWDHLTAPARSR